MTFDEFAMWLRLEDHYWMRSSYDVIIIISAILINIVFLAIFGKGCLAKRFLALRRRRKNTTNLKKIPKVIQGLDKIFKYAKLIKTSVDNQTST